MAVSNGMPRLIVTLGLVAALSAGVLAGVNHITKAPIEKRMVESELTTVKTVMNFSSLKVPQGTLLEKAEISTKEGKEKVPVYRLRSGDQVLAVALKTQFPGYGGKVVCLTGVDPNGLVSGIQVVQHQETPGLGTKPMNDAFLSQYLGKGLEGYTWDVKKRGGSFDAVTGATLTPRAITKSAGEALQIYADQKMFFNSASPDWKEQERF